MKIIVVAKLDKTLPNITIEMLGLYNALATASLREGDLRNYMKAKLALISYHRISDIWVADEGDSLQYIEECLDYFSTMHYGPARA